MKRRKRKKNEEKKEKKEEENEMKSKPNATFWCRISFLKLKSRVSSSEAEAKGQYYKDISRQSRCGRCMDHTPAVTF